MQLVRQPKEQESDQRWRHDYYLDESLYNQNSGTSNVAWYEGEISKLDY